MSVCLSVWLSVCECLESIVCKDVSHGIGVYNFANVKITKIAQFFVLCSSFARFSAHLFFSRSMLLIVRFAPTPLFSACFSSVYNAPRHRQQRRLMLFIWNSCSCQIIALYHQPANVRYNNEKLCGIIRSDTSLLSDFIQIYFPLKNSFFSLIPAISLWISSVCLFICIRLPFDFTLLFVASFSFLVAFKLQSVELWYNPFKIC